MASTSSTTNISGLHRITPWEKKQEMRKKADAVKAKEREMRAEKQAEADRRKQVTKERKAKADEKARLEVMASKMSAKKLQRKKKRMGLTKKVAH